MTNKYKEKSILIRVANGDLSAIGVKPDYIPKLPPGLPPPSPEIPRLLSLLNPAEPLSSGAPVAQRVESVGSNFLASIASLETPYDISLSAKYMVASFGPIAIEKAQEFLKDEKLSLLYALAEQAVTTSTDSVAALLGSFPTGVDDIERILAPTAPLRGALRFGEEEFMRSLVDVSSRLIEPSYYDYMRSLIALDDIAEGSIFAGLPTQSGGQMRRDIIENRAHISELVEPSCVTIRNCISHDKPKFRMNPELVIFSSKNAEPLVLMPQDFLALLDRMYVASTMYISVIGTAFLLHQLSALADRLNASKI